MSDVPAKHTVGPWSLHSYSTPEWVNVAGGESHGPFRYANLAIGHGNKLIAIVRAQTPAEGFPEVESLDEMRANHALMCAAPDMLSQIEKDAARFARIRDWLLSDRDMTGTARSSFANDVWHMECEARAAIAKALTSEGADHG